MEKKEKIENQTVDKMTKMIHNLSRKLCVAIQDEGFALGVDIDSREMLFKAIEKNNNDVMDYDTFVTYFPFLFDICVKEIFQNTLDENNTGVTIKDTFENPVLKTIKEAELEMAEGKLC
ncbi:hypothetical protein [Cetobacterium sp.]|uniref:hypothetical protein n=1 Tax=Cetobacterium sp. TaxID=2071632 RepID=UPI003F397D26